jgi:hypothetical protein
VNTSTTYRDTALKCAMTMAILLLIWARQPELLTEPRFWAEEGASYFSFAYTHSWLVNLFSPQYGYNTLYNSIATSLATLASLYQAPLVTTWLAFFMQAFVSAVVIWWRIPLFDTLWKRFTIALLIQTLAYSRIWLTTIGVQYWLCILTFLILLSETTASGRLRTTLHNGLLFLNGLTGILSCLLIPAYGYKYLKTRSAQVLHQTLILTVCLMVQGGVFLTAYLNKSADLSNRFLNSSFTYILSKLIKFEFSVPFFGVDLYEIPFLYDAEITLRNFVLQKSGIELNQDYGVLESGLGLVAICFLLYLCIKTVTRLETRLFLIALTCVTLVSTYFSINRSGGPRYTFAPSIMIMIFLISTINENTLPVLARYLAACLIVLSVSVSLFQYRSVMDFAYNPSWPMWRFEVYKWQCDPAYQPRIWPPGWQMRLNNAPGTPGQ